MLLEINLRKSKWLLCCSYNPHKQYITNHLNIISKYLGSYSANYERFILIGDLNCQPNENAMVDFCNLFNFKNIVNRPTCFKNPENPSCIDLILTNKPKSFKNTTVIETGLSDFHKMSLSVMKCAFLKKKPNIIMYRSYKHFSNDEFRSALISELYQRKISFG